MEQNYITMKKIFLIISVLVCFTLGSNAQIKPIKFGFKMGPSLDWASPGSTATSNEGVKLGFGAGLIIDYYFTSSVALSSGLNYDFLQMKYQFTDYRLADNFLEMGQIPVNRHVRSTYLEIPLKGKVKMNVVDSWNAYVEAGFGLGLNYSDKAKDEYDFHWAHYSDLEYADYSYQYRPLQASFCFGLGTEFEVNRNLCFIAQLTFHHSLSNTFTHQMQKETGSILNTNFIGIEVGVLH